jgi:comEA protein
MKKFKRDFFFWIERLQITRKERVVISALLVTIVFMMGLTAFIQITYKKSAQNYETIQKEFEEKSALINAKRSEDLKKYSVQEEIRENKKEENSVTEPLVININEADITELQKLKGIGQTYAQRIIDYRQENGEFRTVEELLNVKGIGKKRLDDIKAFITLK